MRDPDRIIPHESRKDESSGQLIIPATDCDWYICRTEAIDMIHKLADEFNISEAEFNGVRK